MQSLLMFHVLWIFPVMQYRYFTVMTDAAARPENSGL